MSSVVKYPASGLSGPISSLILDKIFCSTNISTTPDIDVKNHFLYNAAQDLVFDWGNFQLYDTGGNITVDTNAKQLQLGGNATVDWANRQLIASVTTLNWQNKQALDSNGVAIQWGNELGGGTVAILGLQNGGTGSTTTNAACMIANGHLKSFQLNTNLPTAAAQTGAGTGATTSLTGGNNATDTAGKIILTTGTAAWASGAQTKITFNKAYNVAPVVVFSPANAAAATRASVVQPYVTATTTDFTINFAAADTGANTYNWTYHVIETP